MKNITKESIETVNNLVQSFKKGGIHINPANKGKFNALKAKSGKSTEELKHSKNPLTRRRATFAANSKKWKHKEGGSIEFLQPLIDKYQQGGNIHQKWDGDIEHLNRTNSDVNVDSLNNIIKQQQIKEANNVSPEYKKQLQQEAEWRKKNKPTYTTATGFKVYDSTPNNQLHKFENDYIEKPLHSIYDGYMKNIHPLIQDLGEKIRNLLPIRRYGERW